MNANTRTIAASIRYLRSQEIQLKSGLSPMTIKSFLRSYRADVCDYFGLDDYKLAMSNLYDKAGPNTIICMVDKSETATPSKKLSRKAGLWRRKNWRI